MARKTKEQIDAEIVYIVRRYLVDRMTAKKIDLELGYSNKANKVLKDREGIIALFDFSENEFPELPLPDEISSYGEFIWEEINKKKKEDREAAISSYRETIKDVIIPSKTSQLETEKEIGEQVPARVEISRLYNSEDKQYRFVVMAALHFRLDLNSLSILLGKDQNIINQKCKNYVSSMHNALEYLFTEELYSQEVAIQDFLIYYDELMNALNSGDKDKSSALVKLLADSQVRELKERYKSGDVWSLEDLEILLNYQLKYAISTSNIGRNFSINRKTYADRLKSIFEIRPDLKDRYERLTEWHQRIYYDNFGVKK